MWAKTLASVLLCILAMPRARGQDESLSRILADFQTKAWDAPYLTSLAAENLLATLSAEAKPELYDLVLTFALSNKKSASVARLDTAIVQARSRQDLPSLARLLIRKFVLTKSTMDRSELETLGHEIESLVHGIGEPMLVSEFWFELAEYYGSVRDLPAAMGIIQKNLKFMKEQNIDHSALAYHVRDGIGGTLFSKGEYEGALQGFSDSEQFYRKERLRNSLGNVLYNKAFAYLYVDRSKALPIFMEALKIAKDIKQEDLEAIVLYGLGAYFSLAKDRPQAFEYYKQAYRLALRIQDMEILAEVAFEIIAINIESGQLKQAGEMLEEVDQIIPNRYLIHHEQILNLRSKLAYYLKDYEKALLLLNQQFMAYIDRSDNEKNMQLERIRTELGLKLEEERNRVLQKENASQALMLDQARRLEIFTAVLVLLLLGIAVLLLQLWREHRRVIESQRSMQLILDNIDEGLMTVDESGRIGLQHSRSLMSHLQQQGPLGGASLTEVLFQVADIPSEQRAIISDVLSMTLGEDSIAWDMNAVHLPSEMKFGERQVSIVQVRWIPIFGEQNTLQKVLVCLQDITQKRRLELAYGQQQNFIKALPETLQDMLQADPQRCERLLKDTESVVQRIKAQEQPQQMLRLLHTEKGVARTLGLRILSQELHDLESALLNPGLLLEPDAAASRQLAAVEERVKEYQAMFEVLNRWRYRGGVSSWLATTISPHLAGWKRIVQQAGLRFGALLVYDEIVDWQKSDEDLVEEIALHAVNNSLEHGFIFPNKKGETLDVIRLKMHVYRRGNRLRLEIEDNGVGLNMSLLESIARQRNFVPSGDQTWADVVFIDGVSTAPQLTLGSGRGVGLAAVREKIEQRGGLIRMRSGSQTGTLLEAEWLSDDEAQSVGGQSLSQVANV